MFFQKMERIFTQIATTRWIELLVGEDMKSLSKEKLSPRF
jgi:hypothetical protein